MIKKKDYAIYFIILGMFVFALVFGLVCRITVLAAPPEDPAASQDSTEVTTEDHLSDEELEHILRVSEQWLRNNPVPEVATSTNADYDTNTYLTYSYDDELIDSNTSVNSALNDIYRMILSIRNILLLFFFAFCIYWFDKKFHAIINKLFGGR